MSPKQIETLIVKYFDQSISSEELLILEEALAKESNQDFFKGMTWVEYLSTPNSRNSKVEIETIIQKIKKRKNPPINKRAYYLKYAAVLIGL